MFNNLRNLLADESGATAIEYGLIAALVSVAAVSALSAMGSNLTSVFHHVCEKLNEAVVMNSGTASNCDGATTP